MNDALKNPPLELTLKLVWPNDKTQMAEGQHVVVELKSTDNFTLAAISAPSDQLLKAVSQKLKCYPLISPDGFVSVISDEIAETWSTIQTVNLDQLVAEAIAPEMLEDEPEVAQMLAKFHDRLLKSLEHVEKAIASLP